MQEIVSRGADEPGDRQPSIPAYAAAAAVDPGFATDFVALEAASRKRRALDDKTRALIGIALSASIGLLDREAIRFFTREAIDAGATKGEILDSIRLTAVLGVHGYVGGVMTLLDVVSLDEIKAKGGAELADRAKAARDHFESRRGFMVEAWDISSWLGPDFVTAYADYSARPHKEAHLSRKVRELIYIAVDFFPTMEAGAGGRGHMVQALQHGATVDEILETLEMIALFGFKSATVSLPILADEWPRTER